MDQVKDPEMGKLLPPDEAAERQLYTT